MATPHNRSGEELAMRGHVETWARARWPDARVVHELVVGECRVDIAFIRPSDLIGIEIKSSKDVLTRLDKQARVFNDIFPEFWLAIAPKWRDDPTKPYFYNEIIVGDSGVEPDRWQIRPHRNKFVYSSMLELLWADEARAIAARKGCLSGKRAPRHTVLPELALRLTGSEILNEVCRELRGRSTAFQADPPIRDASPRTYVRPNLFGPTPPQEQR